MKKFIISGEDANLIKSLRLANNLKFKSEESKMIYDEMVSYEDLEEQEKPKPNMLKLLASMISKYDENVKGVNFSNFHTKGKLDKSKYYTLVECILQYIDGSLKDYKDKVGFIDTYKKYTEFLKKHEKGLYLLSEEYYKKPYIMEGLIIILYEFTVEWIPLLVKHIRFGESVFSPEFESSYAYLNMLSVVAKSITDSKEFSKFVSADKTKKLVEKIEFGIDEEYSNVVIDRPELLKLKSESLALYSAFVQEGYFDMIAGLFEKLVVVSYMSKATTLTMNRRLELVSKFIEIITNPDGNKAISLLESFDKNEMSELIIRRAEARVSYDSNIENNPFTI